MAALSLAYCRRALDVGHTHPSAARRASGAVYGVLAYSLWQLGDLDAALKVARESRALVEQEAQSYESPAEVVKWFYMQPQRLSEMEALALETNVVKWVLTKAKVLDKPVAFDELMGAASA